MRLPAMQCQRHKLPVRARNSSTRLRVAKADNAPNACGLVRHVHAMLFFPQARMAPLPRFVNPRVSFFFRG